jgi:nucleotide-binding universal stress UspA family protein
VGGALWIDADADADETIELELTRLRDELGVQTRIITDASVPHALHAFARDEAAAMIVVGSTERGHAGGTPPSRSRTCSPREPTRRCGSSRCSVPPAHPTRPPAGVAVESEILVDDPADVLLCVSAHAGLLVCGSRGYGPLRSHCWAASRAGSSTPRSAPFWCSRARPAAHSRT